jgi:hypothetical protein
MVEDATVSFTVIGRLRAMRRWSEGSRLRALAQIVRVVGDGVRRGGELGILVRHRMRIGVLRQSDLVGQLVAGVDDRLRGVLRLLAELILEVGRRRLRDVLVDVGRLMKSAVRRDGQIVSVLQRLTNSIAFLLPRLKSDVLISAANGGECLFDVQQSALRSEPTVPDPEPLKTCALGVLW